MKIGEIDNQVYYVVYLYVHLTSKLFRPMATPKLFSTLQRTCLSW